MPMCTAKPVNLFSKPINVKNLLLFTLEIFNCEILFSFQIEYKYKARDAVWATELEGAPLVCVQRKVWLEAPSLNRWLTPRP